MFCGRGCDGRHGANRRSEVVILMCRCVQLSKSVLPLFCSGCAWFHPVCVNAAPLSEPFGKAPPLSSGWAWPHVWPQKVSVISAVCPCTALLGCWTRSHRMIPHPRFTFFLGVSPDNAASRRNTDMQGHHRQRHPRQQARPPHRRHRRRSPTSLSPRPSRLRTWRPRPPRPRAPRPRRRLL